MTIDLDSARTFTYANARVLERHRVAALIDGAPAEPVVAALRAYRNPDGGFGHALEPDVRGPAERARGGAAGVRGARLGGRAR